MNTGLQDAFNLGWKLALVCRGQASAGLLDTYETERRPVAERVVSSGAAVEIAHAMTDPLERAARDAGPPPSAGRHRHGAPRGGSRLRARPRLRKVSRGGRQRRAGPGRLLPDTAHVEPVDGDPRPLHQLAHRTGHTLLVLGGPHGGSPTSSRGSEAALFRLSMRSSGSARGLTASRWG
jgi:hypothetical protein